MSTTNVGVRSEALITLVANKTAGSPALVVTIVLAGLISICLRLFEERSRYPLANPPWWYQIRFLKQLEFLVKGSEILSETRKRYGDRPYRLVTELGEVLVLPPECAQLIRNEEKLDFSAAISDDFYGHLPGFTPYALLQHDGQIVQTLVRKQLTKHLSIVIGPLSSEATFATSLIFGNENVARLSSRIFLGPEVCRNQEWLDITKSYPVNSFTAALQMKLVPQVLVRPYSWLSGDCKSVRQNLEDAERVITPHIDKRRAPKADAQSSGRPLPEFDDAIEWAEQESKGVSTSPDHLTFGHGIYACPGRFFAANETQIALCHLLLKYDWKLADGASLAPVHTVGVMTTLDPANKLLYRRRKEEVDLDSLLVSSQD
ncbi:hypothetical protein CBER1_04922 [Cercospora berteroae]|uniref:Cytochrome P450 n=1 Tax=Cercospora berteroae TaxID=357750 RepID=A0A2S6CJJ1_9PEZI|nr:hypothetical protein CBER1_04922 [Cercospora berteroae]